MKSSFDIVTDKPLMDSNLSKVPPVCPNPLPDIFATGTPAAATKGARTIVVLSPTPPVLCLSTLMPLILDKSIKSPERIIWSVRVAVSLVLKPWKNAAIKKAET